MNSVPFNQLPGHVQNYLHSNGDFEKLYWTEWDLGANRPGAEQMAWSLLGHERQKEILIEISKELAAACLQIDSIIGNIEE